MDNRGKVLRSDKIWLGIPRIACTLIRKHRIHRIKGNSFGVTGHSCTKKWLRASKSYGHRQNSVACANRLTTIQLLDNGMLGILSKFAGILSPMIVYLL